MPATLSPGDKAPDFRLARDGGGTISPGDFAGRKLVLFFYPKADTPGCTAESKAFSAFAAAFAQVDTAVVGVSADPVKKQDAFKAKHRLAVPLASDPDHAMIEAYGAWGKKSMYGRTYEGVIRTTVLIGRDGTIARIWPKVSVGGHADEVLEAAQAL
jgi:thioredoxin-dependent peroxiredoxin